MHQKLGLVGAPGAVRIAEVIDSCSSRINASSEGSNDSLAQSGRLLLRKLGWPAKWIDLRSKQRLIGVDVADPGDLSLIEQKRFERSTTTAGQLMEVRLVEIRVEWFEPKTACEISL